MSKFEHDKKHCCCHEEKTLFKIKIPKGTEFKLLDCFKLEIPGGIEYKIKLPLCPIHHPCIPGFDPKALMELYKSPEMAEYLDMLKKIGIDLDLPY